MVQQLMTQKPSEVGQQEEMPAGAYIVTISEHESTLRSLVQKNAKNG